MKYVDIQAMQGRFGKEKNFAKSIYFYFYLCHFKPCNDKVKIKQ